MKFSQILQLIAGLALFLYGMQVMGDALRAASSGKMERLLEKLTSNKWKAAALGTAVTAVIQSSGATVVMVVGLVNSGIMTLEQSAGVTIGANVGTTITAWLLSLTQLTGQSAFFLSLFKPETFSPFICIIGVALLMTAKKDSTRHIASIMTGFGLLMIGMNMMSGSFSDLAENEKFTRLLTIFQDQPLLGLLVGLLVTVVLQSSSASIGVMQSISLAGNLTYGAMLPTLMGANIGSALTGLIGAIGATRNAKRAAWLQMVYCIVKAGLFMVIFYSLNAILHFPFLDNYTDPVSIAIIHTTFNVIALFALLPGCDLLISFVRKLIPILPEEEEPARRLTYLDEHFLNTPGFALEQARTGVIEMQEAAREALLTAMGLIQNYNEEEANKVDRLERTVDEYEDELDSYLVKLGQRYMSQENGEELSNLLHCVTDVERICDHALNVCQAAQQLHEKQLTFSSRAAEEMRIYGDAVRNIVNMAFTAFQNNDTGLASAVEPLEDVIDAINMEEKKRHIRRLRKGKCTIEAGFILSDIQVDYERIADHCSNIAVALLQKGTDDFDTHEYLEMEKELKTPEYDSLVQSFEQKYALPPLKKEDAIPASDENGSAAADAGKDGKSGKAGKTEKEKTGKTEKSEKPAKEEKKPGTGKKAGEKAAAGKDADGKSQGGKGSAGKASDSRDAAEKASVGKGSTGKAAGGKGKKGKPADQNAGTQPDETVIILPAQPEETADAAPVQETNGAEKPVESETAETEGKTGKAVKAGKPEKSEKPAKGSKADKAEKAGKTAKGDRTPKQKK